MTESSPPAPRRLSWPSLVLIAALLVAAVSILLGLGRFGGADDAAQAPLASDWRMVGWAHAENGDMAASAAAYRRAAEIEPENAENWSSLGEVLQSASTTVVPEAAEALGKAIELDPGDPRARYFLAVQKDLRADHAGAVADWAALLRDTPPGAPWRADLQRTLEQVAARHGIEIPAVPAAAASAPTATAAIPGPSREQMAAAAAIPPAEQDAMVRRMVEGLASRLAANPRDAEGWIRLMRSRMVLKDPEQASDALRSALAAFADDPATQGRLRAASAQLGVPEG